MSPQSETQLIGQDTGVPLFSRQPGEAILVLAMFWDLAIRTAFFLTGLRDNILLWAALTLSVGFLLQVVWSFMKWKRFRNPVTNQDLLDLFAEVNRELGAGQKIELWYRDIDRQVFASTSDPSFSAILFSGNTIADILQKSEKGKILLAREVLKIESRKPIFRFLLEVLGFVLISFFCGIDDFLPLVSLLLSYGVAPETMVILIVVTVAAVVAAGWFVVSTGSKNIDERLERLYGTAPDVTLIESLGGLCIINEMIKKAEREKEEGSNRHRTAMRNGALAAVLIGPILFTILFFNSALDPPVAAILSLLIAIAFTGLIFIMVFSISMVWPSIAIQIQESGTEWDIELPISEEIQSFLYSQQMGETMVVKSIRLPFDDGPGLAVLRLTPDYREEPIYTVMPRILNDLAEVELIGPLILAESKMSEIEKIENRFSQGIFGGVLAFVIATTLLLFLPNVFFRLFFWIVLIYSVSSFASLMFMVLWKRKTMADAEAEIAQRHPRYREALRILIKNHHTLPLGKPSYKTRLERIEKRLEKETRVDSS